MSQYTSNRRDRAVARLRGTNLVSSRDRATGLRSATHLVASPRRPSAKHSRNPTAGPIQAPSVKPKQAPFPLLPPNKGLDHRTFGTVAKMPTAASNPPSPQRPTKKLRPTIKASAPPTKPSTARPTLDRPARPKVKSDQKLEHLRAFNKKYLGHADYDETAANLGESFYSSIILPSYDTASVETHWQSQVPTRPRLFRNKFGRPCLSHSFHQEPCLDTSSIFLLQTGFLDPPSLVSWCHASPVIGHLAATMVAFREYDFRWAREYKHDWATQTAIDPDRQIAYTAMLLHFNLDVSLLMRYLGNNYTGEYRDVPETIAKLRQYNIPEELIDKYRRVLLTGCPAHFVAETSRENALLYLQMRNGPTIATKLDQVSKTMNKEDKNNFIIPLPHWLASVVPHLFFTPQHCLVKPGKNDRQIFDASKRYNATCTPLNMMTSTRLGTEDDCLFGNVRELIWSRLYNLRAAYPDDDLIIHANDVKSCFRQVKLHPDIMGAFSYIIADKLFLSCGLPFGTDFSPQNWEPLRRILEILAERLFDNESLRDKHRKYLDQLVFDQSLGHPQSAPFTKAVKDDLNPGVLGPDDLPQPTPHHYYVDDGVYSEVLNRPRIEQALAASIEAIFLLLGNSDLRFRQDPVSFDKLVEMMISHINKVLGHMVDTRRLTVSIPEPFLQEVLTLLHTTWGDHRKAFTVKEAEELCGKLNHIAITAPWLKFLMDQLYQSLSCALKLNERQARRTCRSFQESLRALRRLPATPANAKVRSFHQAQSARLVHLHPHRHYINPTLRKELRLIRRVLADKAFPKASPISHLIPRVPLATSYGDSSLDAAGGFCPELSFWWYIEWPTPIRSRTLRVVKNNKDGNLISINTLEYVTKIITDVIAYQRILDLGMLTADPHPHVLYRGDNTASESWSIKGAKHSKGGRALGRLQCALMVANPVLFRVEHISTEANVVADKISRIPHEALLSYEIPRIKQAHPEMAGCQRYLLSSSQLSCLLETLLQAECNDPIAVSRRLLTAQGKITT